MERNEVKEQYFTKDAMLHPETKVSMDGQQHRCPKRKHGEAEGSRAYLVPAALIKWETKNCPSVELCLTVLDGIESEDLAFHS